ncbi:MAG: holo-ACP synthase [Candidatus Saganbacteria bacterium]|nr:holo-ACP synthase [Candidatus Saganbacteria bacterium]
MIKGIGIDIVEIERIKNAVKRHGDKFLNRVYTSSELSYCKKFSKFRFPELSVRFAAKEAYAKAIGTGMNGIHWRQIEVRNDKKGKPYLKLNGRTVKKAHVTLSHSRDYGVACVVLE